MRTIYDDLCDEFRVNHGRDIILEPPAPKRLTTKQQAQTRKKAKRRAAVVLRRVQDQKQGN